ncbi:MAG: DNA-3-methyladenine glycosylase [Ilumatobacteraceae bacterium]
MRTLPRRWFERDADVVAPLLLNKVLMSRGVDGAVVAGRIVEVEAYAQDDPASHSYGRRTPRNAVMYGPAGCLYVYLSYGIHRCVNVVTAADGVGAAVLIRAVEPVDGIDVMRVRRGAVKDVDLADGPGKIGQAFAIGLDDYGLDLTDASSRVRILDDGTPPPAAPLVGPRIGLTKAVETPWRFRVPPGLRTS